MNKVLILSGLLETKILTIGEVAADLIVIVRNIVSFFIDWLSLWVEKKAGKKISKVLVWLNEFISGIIEFIASLILALFKLLGGTVAGCINLLAGLLSFNKHLIMQGPYQILVGWLIPIIIVWVTIRTLFRDSK